MELSTIIAFGIGFFTGGATIGAFAYINRQDWGEPGTGYNPPQYQNERPNAPPKQPIPGFTSGKEEWVDPHEEIDYADIPAFLRRQAD